MRNEPVRFLFGSENPEKEQGKMSSEEIREKAEQAWAGNRQIGMERERVRERLVRKKWARYVGAGLFLVGLAFLTVKAGGELVKWLKSEGEEAAKAAVAEEELRPSVEVIDEVNGKVVWRPEFKESERGSDGVRGVSSRVLKYVAELEKEFGLLGYKVVRARIPVGKTREVDVEVEGVSGTVKTSLDRNAAVTAEDGGRMIRYLNSIEVGEFEYIDVRLSRKGYWK